MSSIRKSISFFSFFVLFFSGFYLGAGINQTIDQSKEYLLQDIKELKEGHHFFFGWKLQWDDVRWNRLFNVLERIRISFNPEWFIENQAILVEHANLTQKYMLRVKKSELNLPRYMNYLSYQKKIIMKARENSVSTEKFLNEYCSGVAVYIKRIDEDFTEYIKMLHSSYDLVEARIRKIEQWIKEKNKARLLGGGFLIGSKNRLFEKYEKELELIFKGITNLPAATAIVTYTKIAVVDVFEILNPREADGPYLCDLGKYREFSEFSQKVRRFATLSFNFSVLLKRFLEIWNEYLNADFFDTSNSTYQDAMQNFTQTYWPFFVERTQKMQIFINKEIKQMIRYENKVFVNAKTHYELLKKHHTKEEIITQLTNISTPDYATFLIFWINDALRQLIFSPQLKQFLSKREAGNQKREMIIEPIVIPVPSAPALGE